MYIIDEAFANDNSITFCSELDSKMYGAMAEYADGAMYVARVRVDKVNSFNRALSTDESMRHVRARALTVLTFAFLLTVAWFTPYHNVNCFIIVCATIFGIDIGLYHCSIAKFFEKLWYHFDIKSSERNRKHCAEHKVINAYNTLKRVPTVQEARKFTGFSAKCGDVKNIGCVQALIVFGLMSVLLNYIGLSETKVAVLYFITCGIYAVIYWNDLYKYLGWFSLERPKDADLQMAISALEEYVSFQDDLKANQEKAIQSVHDVIQIYED